MATPTVRLAQNSFWLGVHNIGYETHQKQPCGQKMTDYVENHTRGETKGALWKHGKRLSLLLEGVSQVCKTWLPSPGCAVTPLHRVLCVATTVRSLRVDGRS